MESRLPNSGGGGFVLEPGSFDVVLLVDNREVIGGGAGGKESRKQVTVTQLEALNVSFVAKLSSGWSFWLDSKVRLTLI